MCHTVRECERSERAVRRRLEKRFRLGIFFHRDRERGEVGRVSGESSKGNFRHIL